MPAELISLARCPLVTCGSTKARLTLSKKGLAVLTCNTCHLQAFARHATSDEGLRALIVKDSPGELLGGESAGDVKGGEPAPAPVTDTPPAAQAAPVTGAPDERETKHERGKRRAGWGVLG